MPRALVMYCDESVGRGRYYSNFYGGLLVRAEEESAVTASMQACVSRLGLRSELKWGSVTRSVFERYIEVIESLFDHVDAGRIKLRVMFTQNRDQVTLATRDEIRYQLLYYQFIKWAFGLPFAGTPGETTLIRLRIDQMPVSDEHTKEFKRYVENLRHDSSFRAAGITFDQRHIEQIDSRSHVLAQCLDIVLGAMAFRLNDGRKEKPAGARGRGDRTICKERVYRAIHARICRSYPRFNIGVTTGTPGGLRDRWDHPYRHWLFVPYGSVRDDSKTKRKAR